MFPDSSIEYVTIEEFRPSAWHKLNEVRAKKYDAIVLACYDYELQRGLEKWQGYFLLTGAKKKLIIDLKGRNFHASLPKFLIKGAPHIILETLAAPFAARRVGRHADKLLSTEAWKHESASLNKLDKICYLRTDLWFGIKSGGSVTHISGVAKGFSQLGYDLFFASSDKLELVDESVTPINVIRPSGFFKSVFEIPDIVYTKWLVKKASSLIEKEKPDMLYQRCSIFNYAGVLLAKKFNLPFVLEYNGSEVWIAKNWGTPYKYQYIAETTEMLNLKAADLIVVVSEPLKEGLLEHDIPEDKILVNPNGVDVDRIRPDIDGSGVRKRHDLESKTVIGFIGTFGKWHGAEVLAKTVKPIVDEFPNTHFLFVGDGVTMPIVREQIKIDNVGDHVTLTGMVPQLEGPSYLAACDVLASPHVPNSDGSKFFGSPTKLFEYMAMGRGIVASDLDQIGEILEHKKTAWLTEPGDVDSFREGLRALIKDESLRKNLGEAAREEVIAKYTWKEHSRKIIEALKERMS